MNRITAGGLYLVVAMGIMIHPLSAAARAEKNIGILMFSEERRHIEAKNGILDQLKKDGFGEPAARYTIENAGGSKAKAAELAQKFSEAKMDLIFTLGTGATMPVAKMIKKTPLVFSIVYDPVEAGIAMGWKSSGNNTTGVSSRVPMSRIVSGLKEFAPVERLAVLYTPGEKNSELQLRELQGIQTEARIKIIPIILSRKEQAAQSLSAVVHATDAFYLTGSSIISEAVSVIVDMANTANVITITHLDDLVEKGVLLGVCANSYRAGRLAGKKAVKILNGAKPSSIPIETEKKPDIILNRKTASEGQFRIPPEFMKTVTKTIE